TGEITLRGQVMPVGGIKEKVLAAHRAGLKTIIMPARNEIDLEELPKEVRAKLDFKFVKTMDEVLGYALASKPAAKAAKPKAAAKAKPAGNGQAGNGHKPSKTTRRKGATAGRGSHA